MDKKAITVVPSSLIFTEVLEPDLAASLLIAVDRTLVCHASAWSQTRLQKLSSHIVPFRFFSRF
jgi:hypothetical protein